jgi:hypothetical protein
VVSFSLRHPYRSSTSRRLRDLHRIRSSAETGIALLLVGRAWFSVVSVLLTKAVAQWCIKALSCGVRPRTYSSFSPPRSSNFSQCQLHQTRPLAMFPLLGETGTTFSRRVTSCSECVIIPAFRLSRSDEFVPRRRTRCSVFTSIFFTGNPHTFSQSSDRLQFHVTTHLGPQRQTQWC